MMLALETFSGIFQYNSITLLKSSFIIIFTSAHKKRFIFLECFTVFSEFLASEESPLGLPKL